MEGAEYGQEWLGAKARETEVAEGQWNRIAQLTNRQYKPCSGAPFVFQLALAAAW